MIYHEGNHKKCVMGDGCAVTNSAIMLAGSSVGAGALVGDLTLLRQVCRHPERTLPWQLRLPIEARGMV